MRAALKGTLIAAGLTKSYKGRQVVNGVSLGVRAGEAVGLLGPNGAGKTTCFYMVTGLVPVDKGKIEIDGFDITNMPMYRRARLGIGYLPQEASIFRGLDGREQHSRRAGSGRKQPQGARTQSLDALLEEFHISHLRKSPVDVAFRRRAAAARNRPRAGDPPRTTCCSTSLSPASTLLPWPTSSNLCAI